jgi:adenylate cyclase class 2
MSILNFEFKARTTDLEKAEMKLLELSPRFIGEDHQRDTYFNTNQGRLKLREGNIENALIYYERENTPGAKQSKVLLYNHQPDKSLMEILRNAAGIKIVVDKTRRIYFLENVKFHFDTIRELGTFIEVEAISKNGEYSIDHLKEQCGQYASLFDVRQTDFIHLSYSDLLLLKKR